MFKKRIFIFSLLFVMICTLYVIPAKANNENDTIKVGYMSYRSFIEKRDNRYRGFGVDYLQEMVRYQDFEYDFIKAPWNDLMTKLENGEIDLICTAEKNVDREERFLFSQEPIGYVNTILYTRPENQKLYFEDYTTFNNLKVGVLKDSMQHEIFLRCQEEKNFKTSISLYPDFESMDSALNNKEIDAIVTESLDNRNDLKLLARFHSEPFYFITNKNQTSLMQKIDHAMEEINNNTPYFQADLYYKYFGKNQISVSPAYTKEDIAFTQKRKPINCGYVIDSYPSTYKSKGKPKGIVISLMDDIAKMSGFNINYIPLADYKEGFKAIKNKEIDFLLNHSSYFSEDNTGIKYHSEPLYEIPLTLVSKDGYINSTRGLKLGVIRDMFQTMENELKFVLQVEDVQYYENYTSLLKAVQNGKVDFTVIDSYYTNTLLEKKIYSDLNTSNINTFIPIDIGYGQHVDMETQKIINKTIPFLSNDRKNEVIQNLRNENTKRNFTDYNNYIRSIVIISVLLIGILIFIYIRSSQKFKKSRTYDSLCDCYNLQTFKEKAALILKEDIASKRYVLAIDIENFSYVNHYYGTKAGDDVLKLFCTLIQKQLRLNDLLGRVSKDDFILYLNERPSSNENFLLSNIAKIIVKEMNLDLKLNIKIGIYEIFDANEDISVMIEKALLAKRNIEKGVMHKFYSPKMDKDYEAIGTIEMNKEQALKNNEFVVYYQPKVDLKSEKLSGAEALIRWIKKDGSILPPDMFIPIFERDGFIKKLDLYTLEVVCKTIHKYNFTFSISVNQSRTLLNDSNYINDVKRILKTTNVDASKIEIEITETVYTHNKKRLRNVIEQLHDLGITVSIDDFGSGYSSLSLLTQLPVETVKIDKSVIDNIDNSIINDRSKPQNRETLIKSLINMAHEMDLSVVCEGVETKEQRDLLERLKCDAVQGYYYAKPMPLEKFLSFEKESQD